MYSIQVDHVVYEGYKNGQPFTLVSAMRELYGCGNARVLRADGTPVVLHAGSASEVVHVPSGRRIARRLTWRARRAWLAEQGRRSGHVR